MVVIPLPLIERGSESERQRDRERERQGGREYEASRSDAVCVGPEWLQRHGCKFVKGVALEARGGRHAKAERGKERLYFQCLAEAVRGGIYMR